ncbi:unnamed protein product [Rodentolepis nana]|uniref:MCM_N domain-containing protein n=1 Tax=Rodentolepis nana TaxID=102285 RepID=A0A0R3TH23_RODNA|nr:unnamed protein product [Rodentolepis nana]
MSGSSQRSTQSRRGGRGDSQQPQQPQSPIPPTSSDLFQSGTRQVEAPTRSPRTQRTQQSDEPMESDIPSGLRTSELGPETPLSYTDMSSTAGSNIGEQQSSIRPGVNEASTMRNLTETGSSADPGAQTVIWGTNVNIARVMERFKRFIMSFKLRDLEGQPGLTTGVPLDLNRPIYIQRLEDMAASGGLTLDIDCQHLREEQPELYEQLITFPKEVIPACDASLHALFIDRFSEAKPEKPLQVSN